MCYIWFKCFIHMFTYISFTHCLIYAPHNVISMKFTKKALP